jgi:hypothetical protein
VKKDVNSQRLVTWLPILSGDTCDACGEAADLSFANWVGDPPTYTVRKFCEQHAWEYAEDSMQHALLDIPTSPLI